MASSLRSALSLYAFVVLGVFLLAVPWTPVWRQAIWGLLPPTWGRWFLGGWMRGLVSGLGVLDLAIALQVAGELWGRIGPEDPDDD